MAPLIPRSSPCPRYTGGKERKQATARNFHSAARSHAYARTDRALSPRARLADMKRAHLISRRECAVGYCFATPRKRLTPEGMGKRHPIDGPPFAAE
uniref:Uncharacterized protein n=1 Tax=Mycena chlorophos TaxID=658473 RepID=A0ABQ0M4M3_MYCCL|nr:predicted protein [Mycena chlorophos]